MPTTKYLLDQAQYLATIGHYDEIIALYNNECPQPSGDTELHALRAKAYYNLGKEQEERGSIEEAIEAYKKSLELDPSYENSYYNMAAIYYYDLEQYSDALHAYQQYLVLTRDDESDRFRKTAIENVTEITNILHVALYKPITDPII